MNERKVAEQMKAGFEAVIEIAKANIAELDMPKLVTPDGVKFSGSSSTAGIVNGKVQLWFNRATKHYHVEGSCNIRENIPLIPMARGDLEAGDIAYCSNSPEPTECNVPCLILNDKDSAFWSVKGGITVSNELFKYYWKVVA